MSQTLPLSQTATYHTRECLAQDVGFELQDLLFSVLERQIERNIAHLLVGY